MTTRNMIEAINDAHRVMMARDPDIVVYGEDVGYFGGVFRATAGLQKQFGQTRCFDAPISEGGIVGTAVGMAAYGLKPLIEFFTYRAEGHSTSDDPTGYRAKGEAEEWPLGDPIARLKAHLIAIGEWGADRDEALDKEIDATVRAAQKEAEAMGILPQQGFDNIPSMFEDVYASTPWHLAEQRDQALDEAREYLGHEPK